MSWLTDTSGGVAVLGVICFIAALSLFILVIFLCCKYVCNDPNEEKDEDDECCACCITKRHVVTPTKMRQYSDEPKRPQKTTPIITKAYPPIQKSNNPVISIESVDEGTQTATPRKGKENWSVARERVIRTDIKENRNETNPDPFAISGFWDYQKEQKGVPYREWAEQPPGSPMFRPDTPEGSMFVKKDSLPLKTPLSLRSGTIPSLPPSTAGGRSYYSTNRLLKG